MKGLLRGMIHGRTIQLAEEPGLPDGEVFVIIGSASASSPSDLDALAALRRAAGAWADEAEELERYLDWNRQQRKANRPEPLE